MKLYEHNIDDYRRSLIAIGALSKLFTETNVPYYNYRTTEYLYCRTFGAENLARSDITIDAKLATVGVGIKTFTYKGNSSTEKIAEFNKNLQLYKSKNNLEMVRQVSQLRNERIEFVERTYGVERCIYHCIARAEGGRIFAFEVPMEKIAVDNIKVVSESGNVIKFTDGKNSYSFNISKSTLYKPFAAQNLLFEDQVVFHDDPFKLLLSMHVERAQPDTKIEEDVNLRLSDNTKRIVLPLYSRKGEEKFVYTKSGLNQWNAAGRPRAFEEVYVPINSEVREVAHSLLPPRDKPFLLRLPDGKKLEVKVCQEEGKALMSNPNVDLGNWLLRKVLGLKEGKILTYEKLLELGIDSIEISLRNGNYSANFLPVGSYEDYLATLKN